MLSAEAGRVEWTNIMGSVSRRLAQVRVRDVTVEVLWLAGSTHMHTTDRDEEMQGSLRLRQRPVYGSRGTLKAATFVHNKLGFLSFASQMRSDSNSRGM